MTRQTTNTRPCWEDKPGERLARHLREIAAAIIVFGEQEVRDSTVRLHAWLIERKAALEEAECTRRAEEERRRQEREAEREQARINYLLGQAEALRRADEIRAYVPAVRARAGTGHEPMAPTTLQEWCDWALTQADRIAYKTRPHEPAE